VARLHILKVFVGEGGAGGNLLGVFLEGGEVPVEIGGRTELVESREYEGG
jgi:hypothetical protein